MTSKPGSRMHRRHFIRLSVGGALLVAGTAYALSDRRNVRRTDFPPDEDGPAAVDGDEKEILTLAALAPSGHNTQPWFVQRLGPFHWIIGNDRGKWLPAVDPDQRETLLSLGAFLQNLQYAADALGYACHWTLLAVTPQDERVMEVQLTRTGARTAGQILAMKSRRTVRKDLAREPLSLVDLVHLVEPEPQFIHYLPTAGSAADYLSRQTIEANRRQAARDPAQQELAEWIRFSSAEAREKRDGLTTGSMEITGLTGWVVRNFYGKASVMTADFRERGLAQVQQQVAELAGWILITSPGHSVAELLDTGRRMQRLFLKVRARGIGLHPMTQILEEPATRQELGPALGLPGTIQFILRAGYVAHYPPPVSLRRPVSWFLRT